MTEQDEQSDLRVHAAVCAERYRHITERISRLERIIMVSSTGLFATMLSVLMTLLEN